jgi:hypothetical protein
MIPATTHTPAISHVVVTVTVIVTRPTANTPPPTTGGLDAFESWLIDRLCELESRFETYITESSSRFRHDRR